MDKKLIILKIGGSCLTYKKEGLPQIRQEFLSHIAREIKQNQTRQHISFVIVHGGGSVTHPLLDHYQVAEKCKTGILSAVKDKIAAAQIHLAMSLLNKEVIQAFLDEGIPVWPIQTSALFTAANRKVSNISVKPVVGAIQNGYIPIMHGDFILDKTKTICICSGDLVTCMLAKKLKAEKVLFASDVEGVYNNNPQITKNAKLIKELNRTTIINSSISKLSDHSGSMGAKIAYIRKYCQEMETVIFNGLVKGNLQKALLGKVGTTIKTA